MATNMLKTYSMLSKTKLHLSIQFVIWGTTVIYLMLEIFHHSAA